MKRITNIMIGAAVGLLTLTILSSTASADGFNQNKIIDDSVFDNATSMTAAQIDDFLNSFPNSCISPNSGFKAIEPTGYTPSAGYTYGGYVTAGQVISSASLAYSISPKVLLATLQKEQSLVSGGANFCENGDLNKYTAAVGYGCPDSGTTHSYTGISLYQRNGVNITSSGITCVNSASKAGFSQQVIHGVWLLKFGEQRAEGNIGWAVVKPSWDNSDDPQSCYGGPMTQGSWQRCPSGVTTYFDGYTTIDNTAVHMDNGATAALYWYTPHFHGNQTFYTIYTGWFGNTVLPVVFKTSNSNTIYVQTNGYKFYVPAVSVLQDLGLSTGAQIIPQTTADSIPTPDIATGLSTSLGTLVKSPSETDTDGQSVYLVSAGRRYQITSMVQFADFNLNTANIAYLPLSFINSLTNGGNLSNIVWGPTSNVFQVSAGTKRIILDTATYTSVNPTGAGSVISNTVLGALSSGIPITTSQILVGDSHGTIYLVTDNKYYYVPSPDVLDCWGFTTTLSMQIYTLANDSFMGPVTPTSALGCSINTISSTKYLLNGSNKVSPPTGFDIPTGVIDADLTVVANRLPTRGAPLGTVVKSTASPIVWYMENNVKKGIPSLVDLKLLGYNTSQIDVIQSGPVSTIPISGFKIGPGQVVKANDSPTVYVITSATTKTPFASSDDFLAYGYSWSSIISLPGATLNSSYATDTHTLSKYLHNPSGVAYLMDITGCYGLSATQLTSFGQPLTATDANQTYQSTIFPYINMVMCKYGSVFVKPINPGPIYWVDAGKKNPVATMSKLISLSGQANPYVITLSDTTLATLATGSLVQ